MKSRAIVSVGRRALFAGALAAIFVSIVARPATALGGIWNFEPVDEAQGIYRSGQLNEGDYKELKALGFKSVFSLNDYSVTGFPSETERYWAGKVGIEFHWRSIHPWAKPSMRQIVKIKNELLAAPKPVLVHCHGGSDRTGLVIAAYQILNQGWSVHDARRDLSKHNFNRWREGWADLLPYFREP